jgi:signal transduction histidine kinase
MTAHDVRGPLTKISMLTEATLDGFADMGDDKLEMLEMTQEIAEKALGYVEDILGYARAMKQQEETPVAVDLFHLCSDIAALVDPEANLTIVKPDLWVRCEAVVLQMILRNLMENAVRHAKSRTEITIEAEESGALTFTVADDGDGFEGGDASFAKRIALVKSSAGTRGFGLSAVAHVIQTRGGKLWLGKPDVDLRTRIRFTLPGEIIAAPGDTGNASGQSSATAEAERIAG